MWYEEESAEAECSVCSPTPVAESVALAPCQDDSGLVNGSVDAITPSVPRPLATYSIPRNVDLPHNFYWAIPNKLIGMGCPLRRKHIENLHLHHKVVMVVNLRECGTSQHFFDGTPVQNVHIPIKSFGTPSLRQVRQFIRHLDQALEGDCEGEESDDEYSGEMNGDVECNERTDGRNGTQATNIDAGRCNDCDTGAATANACAEDGTEPTDKRKRSFGIPCKKEESGEEGIRKKVKNNDKQAIPGGDAETPACAVAINCRWGKGRTGLMVCCYLVHKEGITAHDAICRVRGLSAGSVETRGQEEFVEEFYRLKLVKEGREGQYQRSLPYPYTPAQPAQRTVIVARGSAAANPAAAGAGAPFSNGRPKNGGVSYGPALGRACAKVTAGNSNKICWNNSLLVANMYK